VRRTQSAVDIAATRLRQASCRHAAAFLLTVPLKKELQALDELYKAAIAYSDEIRGRRKRRV
jgi:hypothetical protein